MPVTADKSELQLLYRHFCSFCLLIFARQSAAMIRLVTSLFVLTCAVQTTLCQTGDCSTEEGRLAYWTAGAVRKPECYTPVVRLTVDEQYPTAADVSAVSISK